MSQENNNIKEAIIQIEKKRLDYFGYYVCQDNEEVRNKMNELINKL